LVLWSSYQVGCLTYKHPNTSTVFAFYRETLSRFRAPLHPAYSQLLLLGKTLFRRSALLVDKIDIRYV
ncbi:hypothetical protein ABLN72_10460, partial [Mycobacterium tuberculosis]